jgi:hypothetical protein
MNFLALLEQAGAIGTLLKFERGPEPEYRGVLKNFSGEWRRRCRGAAARMDDVLEVWLHRPAFLYLILIDRKRGCEAHQIVCA